MSDPSQIHHEIDYIELAVTDLVEAKRFYREAFGWEFNDYGDAYAGVRRSSGGEVGGLRLDEAVDAGGPLVILYSNDLEASAESVRRAGGDLVGEIVSFPGGRRFRFRDPSGNVLAVWSDR
ncbi:VOC family protein [Gaopeijia maritima]|uniref:VOC family protein n=1 Tax=Gaopeijia maritima TaxID=3119007 RepID=UPI00329242F6